LSLYNETLNDRLLL